MMAMGALNALNFVLTDKFQVFLLSFFKTLIEIGTGDRHFDMHGAVAHTTIFVILMFGVLYDIKL